MNMDALSKAIFNSNTCIALACMEHKLSGVFALFSGGHDSLTATWLASHSPYFKGVIHVHTMNAPIATYATWYVREVSKSYEWRYLERQPVTTYEMLVTEYGFPHPSGHKFMYRYLKERPLRDAKKEGVAIAGGKVGFVTGVRKQESRLRMGYVQPILKQGADIWIAPITNFSKQDCMTIIDSAGLPYSLIKQNIGISGECNCGSMAAPEEKRLMSLLYPKQKQWIERLEAIVYASFLKQTWEAENGFRAWDKVMPERATKWAHGKSIPDSQMSFPVGSGFNLCDFCTTGKLDSNGNVGSDPDLMLQVARLERAL